MIKRKRKAKAIDELIGFIVVIVIVFLIIFAFDMSHFHKMRDAINDGYIEYNDKYYIVEYYGEVKFKPPVTEGSVPDRIEGGEEEK